MSHLDQYSVYTEGIVFNLSASVLSNLCWLLSTAQRVL